MGLVFHFHYHTFQQAAILLPSQSHEPRPQSRHVPVNLGPDPAISRRAYFSPDEVPLL